MQKLRHPSRRSFLSQVAGGSLLIGAGLIAGAGKVGAQATGQASRQMVVDADPRDPARPPANPRTRPSPPTDSDAGRNSDAGGRGQPNQSSSAPAERFIVCPGHPRCPA